MVKQLGLPTYFMTLSCADLRWNELVEIISRLNGSNLTAEDISNLSYFERTDILNSNPVLLARHFQYRVENFFKHIVLNGPLGKVIHYAIRVEFQVRGSPHVHCLLWVENAPVLSEENQKEYTAFLDKAVKCELPKRDNDFFDSVKTYQTHSHSRSCRKYKNIDCRYSFGKFFTNRTLIAAPLPHDLFTEEQKNGILQIRKEILNKVKKYINENLNPKYHNMYDPSKENYNPPKSITEILETLNIEEEEYYGCLSTSPDCSYHIHFQRSPDSCFINNYFEDGLAAWEANIDIQPVLDYYKAVAYMCAYLSKSEDESTEAMKEAAKEAHEIGQSAYEKMKAVSKAYRTHREMSIQEAVTIILPEIWLRKTRPSVTFANSNLPENRYRICRSEEEIASMDDNEINIFKKNMLDRYMDRPDSVFKNGKYAVMDNLCYAQFLSNYVLDTKNTDKDENDCQPEILEELLLEQDISRLPVSVPLMSSKERVKLRTTKSVLRYHVPNHATKPEAFAHHILFMFCPFRDENELNATPSGTYTEKMLQPGVLDVINANKQLSEPFGEMVNNAFIHFNESNANGLDATGEQENDAVRDELEEHLIDDDEENVDENNYCGAPAYVPLKVSDDELNEKIRSLNEKQRAVFDIINKWTRQTMQSSGVQGASKPDPLYIFLTGSAGCGKSHLLTTVRRYLEKALSYNSSNASMERMLMTAPTGVAAVNIDGSTIHSVLGIIPDRTYGKCVSKLSDKKRSALRQRYSDLKVMTIDEISIVSNKLLLYIHQRLCEIFGCATDIPFSGISIIACGDFYQLPPIQQKPVYANFNDPLLNISHCWRNFKVAELTEVMRQRGDPKFIDLLNNVRTGSVTDEDIEILKCRQIETDDPNYPPDAIHIWAENSLVNKHNQKKLDEIPGTEYEIEAVDKLPENITESVLDQVYKRNQMQTGGLAYKFSIKVKAKVMLTSNLDVGDKLCNGQIGTVEHLKFDQQGNIAIIYLKMDEGVGIRAASKDSYGRAHGLVPINRIEKEIKVRKNSLSSPKIKRLQFPLVLSWACTIHKVQGKTFSKIVVGLDLIRQRRFNFGQLYVALSRVTSLAGLYILGEIDKKHITTDQRATREYDYLRANLSIDYQSNMENQEEIFSILLLNIRSISKHAIDVKCDKRIIKNDIICFTETQLTSDMDTTRICNLLSPYTLLFNNASNHKYSNIALGYRESINLFKTISIPGASIFTLSKLSISINRLNIVLLYRKNDLPPTDFMYLIQHLRAQVEDMVHIILGDFNLNALQQHDNSLSWYYLSQDYVLINQTSSHVSGSLLDHIYVHKDYLENIDFDVLVNHVYYSDHDAVRLDIKVIR